MPSATSSRPSLTMPRSRKSVEARRLLNRMYDAFVWRHGPLSSRENIRAFAGDPDHPLLLSLENYDPETKRARKTAVFERRTLERYKPAEHVETAAEALAISLNETGKIHWPRMTRSPAAREKQLQRELDDLIYRNPEGGEWETADRYLSGDVRAKLKAAEAAASLERSYGRNVDGLESRAARRTSCPATSARGLAPRGFPRATCRTSSPNSWASPRMRSPSAIAARSPPGR